MTRTDAKKFIEILSPLGISCSVNNEEDIEYVIKNYGDHPITGKTLTAIEAVEYYLDYMWEWAWDLLDNYDYSSEDEYDELVKETVETFDEYRKLANDNGLKFPSDNYFRFFGNDPHRMEQAVNYLKQKIREIKE